jgi:hypothetical protein
MKRGRAKNSTPRMAKDAAPAKSGKQKKSELNAKREAKRKKVDDAMAAKELARIQKNRREYENLIAEKRSVGVDVDHAQLRPNNSYSGRSPSFVSRGYYIDIPFVCKFCGGDFVFTGKWQKWWYETVKANLWSRFNRCEECQLKLNAAKEAKQQEDARRAAKNKIQKLRAAGKLTPALEKELLAAAGK